MFNDASSFSKNCDKCLRIKINYGHKYVPLEPLSIPSIASRLSIHHKILSRKTTEGSTAVLVVVENCNSFCHLIPVNDTTTETTARTLVKYIIPFYGQNFCLISDKGSGFMSALFAHINAVLGIKHASSAARPARSNGLAASLVKRLSEHLKFYAEDDYTVEQVLPLIEINLRATPLSKLSISLYEIMFGLRYSLAIPGDPDAEPRSTLPHVATDRLAYNRWLSSHVHRLHQAVRISRQEMKQNDIVRYSRAHKVANPTWKVGDRVLLACPQVRSGTPHVITKPRFEGPNILTGIIAGRPDVGQAYELTHEATGKNYVIWYQTTE